MTDDIISSDTEEVITGLDADELKEKKAKAELSLDYRLLFRSDRGARVLADILMNLCWYSSFLPPDEARTGERNVGIAILGRLGHGEEETKSIIKSIVNVPIKGEVI